jgi:ABC-2 type transport system ATP-binding protein
MISFAGPLQVPEGLAGVRHVAHEHARTTLETTALQASLTDLMAWAADNDVRLDDLDARSPSLENVFLAIADGRDPDVLSLQEGSLR